MKGKINEITATAAVEFLKAGKATREQVSISPSITWLGASIVGRKGIIGVVGIAGTARTARIKSFFVAPEFRRKGVGTALLKEAVERLGDHAITCFATVRSRPLFEKLGFVVESEKKNGIVFMRKE